MNLEQLAKDNNTTIELLQQLPNELLQKLLISKATKRNINKELKELLPLNNRHNKLVYLYVLLNIYFNCEFEEEINIVRDYVENNNIDNDALEKVSISYIKELFKDNDFKLRNKVNNTSDSLKEVCDKLTPFE